MKYALFNRLIIVLLLVAATLTGALAAPLEPTPIRQTHMIYQTIYYPLLDTDQLEEDYDYLTSRVAGIAYSVGLAREEITAKIENHEPFERFADLSWRLNFIRGEVTDVITQIDVQIAEAERIGSTKYRDFFIALRETAIAILPEISAQELRITQYRFILEVEDDIHNLEDRYNDAEKEYKELKKQLENALKDGDSADVTRYKNKLRDLRWELDIILDDLQVVFLKIVARNAHDLTDDASAVRTDVVQLQEKIDDLLKLKKVDRKRGNNSGNNLVEAPDLITPEAQPTVVVQQLDFIPEQQESVLEQPPDLSSTIWLIGANIILLAIIIFLVLLMV